MKKVININFQGQVIAIEESAYELLKQYIESLKTYFSREADGEEIVNDIENRIAELFGNRLKMGINCITDDDVSSIISSIGRPEDFDTDFQKTDFVNEEQTSEKQRSTASSGNETQSENRTEGRALNRNANDKILGGVCSGLAHYFKIDPVWMRIIFVVFFSFLFWVYIILWIVLKPKPLETNVSKRLYRNQSNKILGGVCSGFATFFKIDAWIPRLVFAIPLLINVIGFASPPFFPWNRIFDGLHVNWNVNFGVAVIYVILWVIIPKAVTVKQKLEMMGEDEYIKSIRETVSDNVASVKNKSEEAGGDAYSKSETDSDALKFASTAMPPQPPRTSQPKYAVGTQPERSGCLSAIVILLKIIFFVFAGIFTVALLGGLIAFIATGAKFIPLKSLFINSGMENTLFWLVGALVLSLPVIAVVVWIVRRSLRAKSRPVIGVLASILWTTGIVLAVVLGFKIADKFKVDSSIESLQTLTPFAGDKLRVDMSPYPSDYYMFSSGYGPDAAFDELPYYSENEDSLLFSNVRLQVVQSQDSLYHVRTISSSSEKDLKRAKANAEAFSFSIQQKDSILLLPEFFSAPIEQGFRMQGVIVEIAVPAGKKIEMDERLDNYHPYWTDSFNRNRRLKKNRSGNQSFKWEYGEEYILENGDLNKTVSLGDSI